MSAYANDPDYKGTELSSQQTTQFFDSAGVQSSVMPDAIQRHRMAHVPMEKRIHSIPDHLARPVIFFDFEIVHSQVGTIFSEVVPSGSYDAMVESKLRNFRFLRANFHFKIVCNASAYATGRLFVYFVPYATSRDPTPTIYNVMNYPGVEIDIGSGLSPEFVVPFISPFEYLDNYENWENFGSLNGFILNTLRGTDNSERASFTVYTWMTDVDLGIPGNFPTSLYALPTAHMGEAEERAYSGVVSQPLGRIAQVSRWFAGVPNIGPYAQGLSWFADLAAKAASAFGYSRPPNLTVPSYISNVPGMGYTNTNSVDSSVALALDPRNSVSVHPAFYASDEDAMNIVRMCSREVLVYHEMAWSTSAVAGASISTFNIRLDQANAPWSLLRAVCAFWRGSLRVRISCVKNAFYSGRMSIEYVPAPSGALAENPLLNHVFDVRTNSEVIFEVPYVNNVPWATFEQVVGQFSLTVVNQLRAIPGIPSTMYINVYMSVGPDFAVAAPTNDILTLSVPASTLTMSRYGSYRRGRKKEQKNSQVQGSSYRPFWRPATVGATGSNS